MSTEWDGKPPHERAEEWRERLVLALGREQGLRLALAEREISVTLLKRIERDHPALVGHYRYCLRQERLNGNQYLWDQEGANIPHMKLDQYGCQRNHFLLLPVIVRVVKASFIVRKHWRNGSRNEV